MLTRGPHPLGALSLVLVLGCDPGAGRIDQACSSNADCGPTELCATGLCEGGLGVCTERPTMCSDTVNLVCGCDRRTYTNSCSAEMEGVRFAKTGPCLCNDNDECVEEQYCALDNSCDNVGACIPRDTCDPEQTEEVCGCDGNTYENECAAAEAGVRVSDPRCVPPRDPK